MTQPDQIGTFGRIVERVQPPATKPRFVVVCNVPGCWLADGDRAETLNAARLTGQVHLEQHEDHRVHIEDTQA